MLKTRTADHDVVDMPSEVHAARPLSINGATCMHELTVRSVPSIPVLKSYESSKKDDKAESNAQYYYNL